MTGPVADAVGRTLRIVTLDEVGSTNVHAMGLAAAGDDGPLWVTARRQSHGRGRSGRTWVSVDGNLYASFLTRLTCEPGVVPQLSLLAGVALHDAVQGAATAAGVQLPGLRLKWPNDLLLGPAKVAGILPESSQAGDRRVAVIGFGVNVAGAPDGLGHAATSLRAAGIEVAADEILARLDGALGQYLGAWHAGAGFPALRTAWLERAVAVGEAITVNAGSGPVAGSFDGIDQDGALLLRTPTGLTRRFTYGDVTVAIATATPEHHRAKTGQ